MTTETLDLLAGLNPQQQLAVTTTEGPVLVVAGPGSGKTRVLTHRIAYLIREKGVLADQILAVTFTNKAAREMRERIDRLVGQETTNGLVMGTFHSLGVRILRQNPGIVADRLGILPNFLIYDDSDQIDTVKRAIVAIGLDPKHVAPRRMLARISAAKSLLLGPDEFASNVETYDDEVVLRVYREYQRLLRKANAVDFDDLLVLPLRLFDEAPSVLARYQERFQYILVDEYQDTNRVQYVLVAALAEKHRNLFVVGDPDQSIYAWRQADIRNILDFESDYPDAANVHLELNYRSTQRIVETADRVIRENKQRIDRKLRTENEEGTHVTVRELADQHHEARFIVDEIRRLLRNGEISADDIAVMYRTTAQSRVLEESFRISDIQYRIVGGVRFYDRREVKDVLAVLRLLYNPNDEVSLRRIIDNLPLGRGLGPKAVDSLREWATLHDEPLLEGFVALANPTAQSVPVLTGASRSAAQKLGSVFIALRQRQQDLPLDELFDVVVEQTGYQASFNQDSEEEMQRWANVLELKSDLEQYSILPPAEALPTYLEQVALVSDVDSMDETNGGRVTLITLHSAKGLEFPVVFITGVEEGLLPINRAVEAEPFDPSQLEEERRLFYVGITRAEKHLYITFAAHRQLYGQTQFAVPSRFLVSIPQNLVQGLSESRRLTRISSRRSLVEMARSTSDFPAFNSISGVRPVVPVESAPPLQEYKVGQQIFHPRFGEGLITSVVDRRGDQDLTIEFKRHGPKIIQAGFVSLDIIGEAAD
jgi:DNA helicase II / ATP-dependent DNA helicase PcrA